MGKIELGGEDEAEETMEIRGDTVKHKGKVTKIFIQKHPFVSYISLFYRKRERFRKERI